MSILHLNTCATPRFLRFPVPRSLICKSNANTYQFSNGLINARPVFFDERACDECLEPSSPRRRWRPLRATVPTNVHQHREKERIPQLCDRAVPLLQRAKENGGATRRYTEEDTDGRGKYRHLVNTCTSRAGPSRVEASLSSSSSRPRSSTLTVTWPCIAHGLFPFHFLRGKLTSSRCRSNTFLPFYLDSESMIFHRCTRLSTFEDIFAENRSGKLNADREEDTREKLRMHSESTRYAKHSRTKFFLRPVHFEGKSGQNVTSLRYTQSIARPCRDVNSTRSVSSGVRHASNARRAPRPKGQSDRTWTERRRPTGCVTSASPRDNIGERAVLNAIIYVRRACAYMQSKRCARLKEGLTNLPY